MIKIEHGKPPDWTHHVTVVTNWACNGGAQRHDYHFVNSASDAQAIAEAAKSRGRHAVISTRCR